jgi:ankyrin repeat protein
VDSIVLSESIEKREEATLKKIVILVLFVVSLSACGPSALYNAAYRGNSQDVLSLIANGKDVNEKDRNGWTPLMIAAAEGHSDTVKVLLEKGADANAQNSYGRTSLMFASRYGFTQIAELLIKAGADVNAIPNDETRKPALIAAVEKGHLDTVALLLRHGADIKATDSLGFDALYSAAIDGNKQIVELLLQKGANPNVRNAKGNTPLILSINRGFTDVALLLLSYGADPNLKSSINDLNYTALMVASMKGDVQVARVLIDKGANVNDRATTGISALDYAKRNNHADISQMLISAGAIE